MKPNQKIKVFERYCDYDQHNNSDEPACFAVNVGTQWYGKRIVFEIAEERDGSLCVAALTKKDTLDLIEFLKEAIGDLDK